MFDTERTILSTSFYERPASITLVPDSAAQDEKVQANPAPAPVSIRSAMWNDASWRTVAACRDIDTNTFFPVGFADSAMRQTKLAKQICQSCPAQPACLEFALRTIQADGIWGGHTEDERRAMRRARRVAARRARAAELAAMANVAS